MSGTNAAKNPTLGGPAVVLIDPQLGENIGTVARAMLNCGLTDLRLVRPRDGWPNAKARATSSGADVVIDGARLYDRTEDAVADLHRVYATTARPRDMIKTVLTPRAAAAEMRAFADRDVQSGLLFGPERSGLNNDDIALATAIITAPLNPAFASLNLAQAVLLVAHEWFQSGDPTPSRVLEAGGSPQAAADELHNFFAHLEQELEAAEFFVPPEKTPGMVRNIRNMFHRADLTSSEVRTLHGIVTALSGRRLGGRPRNRSSSSRDAE